MVNSLLMVVKWEPDPERVSRKLPYPIAEPRLISAIVGFGTRMMAPPQVSGGMLPQPTHLRNQTTL